MSTPNLLTGRHLPDVTGNLTPQGARPGDYWRHLPDGVWWAYAPRGGIGRMPDHEITEHTDGTITVSPSILITGTDRYHGYLERGVWREV